MKKNIYRLVVLAMAIFGVTACHPEFEGQMPGNDKDPKAAMYTFAPTKEDGDYDADTDVRVLITGNDKAQQVYYKAYKTDNVASMTEAQIISDVMSSGQSVQNPGEGVNVFLTGLQGNNTIYAVASNSNKQTLTEATFFGKTWTNICTGRLRTRFADQSTTAYDFLSGVVLQKNEDEEGLYRLKNPWGTGVNLQIAITLEHEEYDATGWANEGDGDYFNEPTPYQYIHIAKTALGFSAGSYGEISVGDYTSVRGSDYDYYCRLYKNHFMAVYGYYVGGAGNIGSGWLYYYPD